MKEILHFGKMTKTLLQKVVIYVKIIIEKYL